MESTAAGVPAHTRLAPPDPAKLARRRIRAAVQALLHRRAIAQVRHYVLFIGYPRTGHTLVAALLDAHPRMVFSNGLDVGQYIEAGFELPAMCALSIWNSRRFTKKGRRSNGYDYSVRGGWHGRWEALHVVGDKSGDLFSEHLRERDTLMDKAVAQLGGKLRLIHVLRNPFDVIATMARRSGAPLEAAADEFLALAAANRAARARVPADAWFDLRLEELIARPARALGSLCGFLGETAPAEYVEACSRLIFPSPRRSRDTVQWSPALLERVSAGMREFPWFDGYDFHS